MSNSKVDDTEKDVMMMMNKTNETCDESSSSLIAEPCRTLNGICAIAKRQGKTLDRASVAFTLGHEAGIDFASSSSASSTIKVETTKTSVCVPDKLSWTIQPTRYEVELTPNLETLEFKGKVDIEVYVAEATDRIRLHAKEIDVRSVSVKGMTSMKLKSMSMLFEDDLLTLVFDDVLPRGHHVVSIAFKGRHNDQMAGFYRSRYKNVKGEEKIMVTTQFEALDARRCFPCWDEPACKATFACTLIVDTGLDALSNMPVKSQSLIGDGAKTRFEFMETPRMSTYLLAFCVGEFDFVAGTSKNGVSIRCYTPPGRSAQGQFALNVAIKTLDLYDDFFGIPYPLPKLDMIAITEFAAGAMENWGLVTYREVDLLIEEKTATEWQKQRVCTVVTHELAHQWFGNLVTMDWWNDLWLNEGFACWTQTYAANKVYPNYKMWDQFVSDDMFRAQGLDALRSSHPIQVPIRRAEEVEAVFDAISYSKGACVVRMCYELMGEEKFRDGLRVYMKRHQYGNTKTSDLWRAWQEASGMDIPALMASWTEQMGYPLLTVTNVNASTGSFDVSQSWFLADGSGEKETSVSWNVPLFACTDASATSREQLEMMKRGVSGSVSRKTSKPFSSWIKLNAGQPTMVRVLYPADMYPALIKACENHELSTVDRAGLINDTYNLAKIGKIPPSTLLDMLRVAKVETEYAVWGALGGAIRGVNKALSSGDDVALSSAFRQYASELIAPTLNRLGWKPRDKDGHLDVMLRALIINLAGDICEGDPKILLEASNRFNALFASIAKGGKSTCAELPSDLTAAVFKIVLRAGGKAEFDQVMKYWTVVPTNAERKFVYGAIGATSDAALKKRVMEWARDDLKMQDFFYPMRSVSASGPVGADVAWTFVQENFVLLADKIGPGSAALLYAVIACCSQGKCTFKHADAVEEFYLKREDNLKRVKRCEPKIRQMLESMRNLASFVEKLQVLGKENYFGH